MNYNSKKIKESSWMWGGYQLTLNDQADQWGDGCWSWLPASGSYYYAYQVASVHWM